MVVILSTVHSQFVLVYLDGSDIISKRRKAHIAHMRYVLTLCRDAGVNIKLKKCRFFSNTINTLADLNHPGQLAVSQNTIDPFRYFELPNSILELRPFLGLHTLFSRSQPTFHELWHRWNKYCGKTYRFPWTALQRRVTRPKNIAGEGNHAANVVSSVINWYPYVEQRHLWSLDGWIFLYSNSLKDYTSWLVIGWNPLTTRNGPMKPYIRDIHQWYGVYYH